MGEEDGNWKFHVGVDDTSGNVLLIIVSLFAGIFVFQRFLPSEFSQTANCFSNLRVSWVCIENFKPFI